MTEQILTNALLILLLLDPLGNMPFFAATLKSFPQQRQQRILIRENLIAMAVLIIFALVGEKLLSVLRLTSSALEISGGLILFMIAIRMVFPASKSIDNMDEPQSEPFIVPIAIPMIVGPASLATVIITAKSSTHYAPLIFSILIAVVVNLSVLLLGGRLIKYLGKIGLEALERLMGLILTTLAVQMLITGFRNAFLINI